MAVKKKTTGKAKPKVGIIKKAKKVNKAVVSGAAGGAVKGAIEAGLHETKLDKKPPQPEAAKNKTSTKKSAKGTKASSKK